MKARLLSLAACAAATALLLPALPSGAAAEPPGQEKKQPSSAPTPSPSAPPAPACAVTVDPSKSTGAAGGAVLKTASQEYDPVKHPQTLGYYLETSEYGNSSTFAAEISYTPPASGGCGTISLLTFPIVAGAGGTNVFLPQAQSRSVQPSGSATSVTIESLVVGLPAENQKDDQGLCVGSQIQVRDSAGAVVATFPSKPIPFCPGGGQGRTYI